jgi:hypothetical protein
MHGGWNHRRGLRPGNRKAGFSIVEVAILAVLLLVAVGGLSGAVLSSLRLSQSAEESARADQAAHLFAAELRRAPFATLFARYNSSTGDDPVGTTSPGGHFEVEGLTPRRDDADGFVGRIVFPSSEAGGVEILDETVSDARLGMPEGMDLDGDGALGNASATYDLLPVRLILECTGTSGPRLYELDLLLTP